MIHRVTELASHLFLEKITFSYLSFYVGIHKIRKIINDSVEHDIQQTKLETHLESAELSIMSFNVYFGRRHPYRAKKICRLRFVEDCEVIMRRYFMFTEIVLFSPFSKHGVLSELAHISPHCAMRMGSLGLLLGPVGTFSIFLMISKPSTTFPKTTCFPSNQSHLVQVMKN